MEDVNRATVDDFGNAVADMAEAFLARDREAFGAAAARADAAREALGLPDISARMRARTAGN